MRIVEQSAKIVIATPNALELIIQAARCCYQSHDRNEDLPAFDRQQADARLIKKLIDSGHHSVLEHASFTARFVTDRATTHEMVRHRLASFSQESTRYCRYVLPDGDGHITVVWPFLFGAMPEGLMGITPMQMIWAASCEAAEKAYESMLKASASPQLARKVLPQSLKAEIWVTANFREWRHIFNLRCSKAADPQISALMWELRHQAIDRWPTIFSPAE